MGDKKVFINKQRKEIEVNAIGWESLEIYSRKWELSRKPCTAKKTINKREDNHKLGENIC